MGAASRFSRRRFGGPTRTVEVDVTVGTTVTTVATEHPDRVQLTVQNRSANAGALATSRAVTTDDGLYMAATDGGWVFTVEDDGDLVGYAWYGINTTGAGTWHIIEVIALPEAERQE